MRYSSSACSSVLTSARALGAVVLGMAVVVPPGPAAGRAEQLQPARGIREYSDVSYCKGRSKDAAWHKLDLYLPATEKKFPVVVFVHGGAWTLGDKRFFGWGPEIGRYFAGQGFGVVMPSYRLSPAVKYPEHENDVAQAVGWTYGNIARYGGNADLLFLCGHSAGGQLVSLLATDESFLKALGLHPDVIKGVISVSGVYRIPEINLCLALDRHSAGASIALPPGYRIPGVNLDLDHALPHLALPAISGNLNVHISPFRDVFGDNATVCSDASPINHIRAGLPPFLLIYADHDLPTLADMAREFADALTAAGDRVSLLKVEQRDHETIMFSARTPSDPVAQAITRFMLEHGADR